MENNNQVNKFHPNSTEKWGNVIHLCDSHKDHNQLCKINSKACSTKMSPYNDLCLWHYCRMAKYYYSSCGCCTVYACYGDSTGRHIFREYYNCWDIPVKDSFGKFYCCGQCQNRDSETHYCGTMLVGECCIAKHPGANLIE
jgi:hypothetical protein